VTEKLQDAVGAKVGGLLRIELSPVDEEPDPELPEDLEKALLAEPEARRTWDSTTAVARVDWIHWVVSAKQAKTREKRIRDACEMLPEGKEPSGPLFFGGSLAEAIRNADRPIE
jgi:uncharacterized protein YdeI (YjbR/CyaY-like superfamily)